MILKPSAEESGRGEGEAAEGRTKQDFMLIATRTGEKVTYENQILEKSGIRRKTTQVSKSRHEISEKKLTGIFAQLAIKTTKESVFQDLSCKIDSLQEISQKKKIVSWN